jgi:hypothetical protein
MFILSGLIDDDLIVLFWAARRCASALRFGARCSLGPLRGLGFAHPSASLPLVF